MKTFKVGDFVQYSAHYLTEHKGYNDAMHAAQRGIVVDVEVYQEKGEILHFPQVHWSGAPTSSSCHPLNVDRVADVTVVVAPPAEPIEIAAALAVLGREAQRWEGLAKQYKFELKAARTDVDRVAGVLVSHATAAQRSGDFKTADIIRREIAKDLGIDI